MFACVYPGLHHHQGGRADLSDVLAVLFGWAGGHHGKTVVAWSALRKVLREEIIKSHAQSFTSCPNLANVSSASSQDIANAVLDLLGADDTATEAQSSHCVRARSPLAFKVIRRFNYKRT